MLDQAVWMGFVRHILTLGGGVLIAKGYADESMVNELVGALVTVIGFGWSYLHKQADK